MCIPIVCVRMRVRVCVPPAEVHVGQPRPGFGREEGGAGPPAAAWASGRGQCGVCGPGDGGDVHLPLAAGTLRGSVRPACLVQHCGRPRQHIWSSEQKTGKSN